MKNDKRATRREQTQKVAQRRHDDILRAWGNQVPERFCHPVGRWRKRRHASWSPQYVWGRNCKPRSKYELRGEIGKHAAMV